MLMASLTGCAKTALSTPHAAMPSERKVSMHTQALIVKPWLTLVACTCALHPVRAWADRVVPHDRIVLSMHAST